MSMNRFTINLASNVLGFGISVLAGLWLTPFLIRHLGVGAYGLIPLAVTLTSYMALFTSALNASSGRFLTMALDRKDYDEANRIFNTSFWGSVAILLLLLLPCLWLTFHAGLFLSVPAGHEGDFTGLLAAAIGIFYLTTLGSAFSITAFCRNRFDLSNGVSTLSLAVRLGVIALLFSLFTPHVWHVGFALFLAAALTFGGAILISRNLAPMLVLRLSWFDWVTLRAMTGMGGWIVINHLGVILFLSIDLLVVNKMLGSEATGYYGAVMTWATLLRSFAGVIAGIFGPTMIVLYSRGDLPGLVRYARQSVKFLGLIMALAVGLIAGFSAPLLSLWLGESYAPLAPLMSLMTLHLCVNLAVLPLFNIQIATNHVRLPGITTCVMGTVNLILAFVLAGPVGWGMMGVAAAGAITLTGKNLIFTPLYAARILNLPSLTFFREVIPIIGTAVLLTGTGWMATRLFNLSSWTALILAALGTGTIFAGLIVAVVLTKEERRQLAGRIPGLDRLKGLLHAI